MDGQVSSSYPSAGSSLSLSSHIPGSGLDLNFNDGPDAAATGHADFGVLHLTLSTTAHSDGSATQQSVARMTTDWTDTLTFTPSGPTGTPHLMGGFWVYGSVLTTAGLYNLSTTNLVWQFDVYDASAINHVTQTGQYVTRSNGFNEGTDFLNSFIPLSIPMYGAGSGTFTVTFRLLLTAGSSASTTFPGVADTAHSEVDLGDTILWGGLSVLDDSDQTVGGTLTSDTGFNWSQPQTDAPEPGSLLLAASAGLVLWKARRRG